MNQNAGIVFILFALFFVKAIRVSHPEMDALAENKIYNRKFLMRKIGFTLAELLIALSILGVIATFTIPKVLQTQQNVANVAKIKETMAMFSGSYSNIANPSASTGPSNLTPYMNYVSIDTQSNIDNPYGQTGSRQCTSVHPCLSLHNGAKAYYDTGDVFGATNTTNYIYMSVDPDGVVTSSSTTNGPGKSMDLTLYYNGRLSFLANCRTGDVTYLWGSPQVWCPGDPAGIPSWFSL
jgi:prepilin-type N-terminal cleavage/methylation domain-containing protein